jgi:hypothetical protein
MIHTIFWTIMLVIAIGNTAFSIRERNERAICGWFSAAVADWIFLFHLPVVL